MISPVLAHGTALVTAFVVVCAISGCEDGPAWKSVQYKVIDMARASESDALLPGDLWDKIEGVGAASSVSAGGGGHGGGGGGGHDGGGGGHGGGAASAPSSNKRLVEFAAVKAYLREKTPGTLAPRAVALEFGEGGGTVDFSKYAGPRVGAFYVVVEFSKPQEEGEVFKAYFLSSAPTASLGGRRHGAGCDRYYDITSYVEKTMTEEGMLVSSSEMRHAFALGGTLFLARGKGSRVKVARITFTDSRAPSTAHCPVLKPRSAPVEQEHGEHGSSEHG